MILIEGSAGVGGRTSAVLVAVVVVVVVVLLRHQLLLTVDMWVATLLTHILTLRIHGLCGLASTVLVMGESIVKQWVWHIIV